MAGAGIASAAQAATSIRRSIDWIIAVGSSGACPGPEPIGAKITVHRIRCEGAPLVGARSAPHAWKGWRAATRAAPTKSPRTTLSHLRRVRAHNGLVDVGAPAVAAGRGEHAVLDPGRIGEQLRLPRHLVD